MEVKCLVPTSFGKKSTGTICYDFMRFAALLIYGFLSIVYRCTMDNDIYTRSSFMFFSISIFGSLSPDVGTVALFVLLDD